jgi:hypothetical protein
VPLARDDGPEGATPARNSVDSEPVVSRAATGIARRRGRRTRRALERHTESGSRILRERLTARHSSCATVRRYLGARSRQLLARSCTPGSLRPSGIVDASVAPAAGRDRHPPGPRASFPRCVAPGRAANLGYGSPEKRSDALSGPDAPDIIRDRCPRRPTRPPTARCPNRHPREIQRPADAAPSGSGQGEGTASGSSSP